MENGTNGVIGIFFDGEAKRFETFYTADEVFDKAGLDEADDEEAQAYRLAITQSCLGRYAKSHADFIAYRPGKGEAIQYGFTKNKAKLIADAQRRNKRAERQIEDASDRSEKLLAKFPDKKADLRIEIPNTKRQIILLKKWSPKEIRNKVLYG